MTINFDTKISASGQNLMTRVYLEKRGKFHEIRAGVSTEKLVAGMTGIDIKQLNEELKQEESRLRLLITNIYDTRIKINRLLGVNINLEDDTLEEFK